MIKSLVIDRDGVINHHSPDPASPFYYITCVRDLVIKPQVRIAFQLLYTLQKARGLKVYLATKQRCVSKGLVTRARVDEINECLQDTLGFRFDGVYVEESAPDKRALYAAVLRDSGARPEEAVLIDDSMNEIAAWKAAGCWAYYLCGDHDTPRQYDLYRAVCSAFAIS